MKNKTDSLVALHVTEKGIIVLEVFGLKTINTMVFFFFNFLPNGDFFGNGRLDRAFLAFDLVFRHFQFVGFYGGIPGKIFKKIMLL